MDSSLLTQFTQSMHHILTLHPKRLTIALSGGLDSVVLTRLACAWHNRTGSTIPLSAAHINHCLRGKAADNDEAFCRSLAGSFSIDFFSQRVNVAAVAERERIGVEEAGRRIRYRFFHELTGSDGIVLTGHHANDQVETILLNLRRGAHARGLAGMREIGWTKVPPGIEVRAGRPLLHVFRAELRALAEREGWRWREDATNADAGFMRNRIRLRIVPALEKLMPGFCERLLARAEEFREEDEGYTEKAQALVSKLCREENGGVFLGMDGDAVAGVGVETVGYAVREVAEGMLGGRVSSRRGVERVVCLIASGRMNEAVMLPGGLHVRREREGVFFCLEGATERGKEKEAVWWLPEPPFVVKGCGVEISAEWVSVAGGMPDEDRRDTWVQWFNGEAIRFPLCFRAPFVGERFRGLGAPGGRKIHDILIDLKVPRRQRLEPRVLADRDGALWVWPYRMAERVRLTDECVKALRVKIALL